jgi:diaminohydroxyphosphoribosylaminopyrimidine deaminase / 5-amino-6-(5-phosphoribosylamino)uracil reductase
VPLSYEQALRRAVDLSRTVLGRTSPNPPVGAVVLDAAGEVVGEGATQPPGGPHAEVVALQQAGGRARGGTAVVTLEPCAHTGRTPPCTDALLAAGVARVVVGVGEPTALAGGGAERLRAAGVEVDVLDDQGVARGPLEAWLGAQRLGRPFVTWKTASTLDGRSAAADGTSRWITSEAARADVHRLRAEFDAVLAGAGTVLQDDPLLDVRPAVPSTDGGHQPLRVVVDTRARTPLTARCLAGPSPALVVTGPRVDDPGYPRTAQLPLGEDGHVDLPALLDLLQREHGVVSALLEGGALLAGAFVGAGLVDRTVAYLAPALLGDGAHSLSGGFAGTITAAHRFRFDEVVRVGDDLRLTMRRG